MKAIIYSTKTCPYCDKAKDFFKKNRIKFREIDVIKNKKAAAEMIKKTGQTGVPVIDANGKIIIGFNEQKLRQIFRKK